MVDLEKVWDLVVLVCETLNKVEYRQLVSVQEQAFLAMSQLLYKAALSPGEAVESLIVEGVAALSLWWDRREAGMAEATLLTKGILQYKAIKVGPRLMPIDKLPPETIGPMLWVLTESYVGNANNLEQEQAIVELLSRVRRWRHLLEVLEHMSFDGRKVNATDSLNRINSFLVDKQQDDFNRYLDELALQGQPSVPASRYAWNVSESLVYGEQKRFLLASAARRSDMRIA